MVDEKEVRSAMDRHKFYHIIELTSGIVTPGNPAYVPAQQACMRRLRELDLRGKRVLDIGCRDGLFSFAAERMGAAEVVGIDNDLSVPAREFLIPFFKSKVRMVELNLYDLTPDRFGRFDVVIFPGVLYHLRYPFWGLKRIRDVMNPGAHLLIETPIWERDDGKALLYCPTGEESPYEPTSCTFFNEKGLRDSMASLGCATHSVDYVRSQGEPGPLKARYNRIRNRFRTKITRAVFHATRSAGEQDAFLAQYWEGTHRFHTQTGG